MDSRPVRFDVDDIIVRLLKVRGPAGSSKNFSLTQNEVQSLCMASREIFLHQPTLLELEAPVKIFSDIHGQYDDLLRIFDLGGYPPDSNYLALGDYVDRGSKSLEVICLLMAYKIKYPENIFLLRGNHECASINRIYGFYDECKRRLSIKIWKTFIECFRCLPLAAVIEDKIFCVHGGISPDLMSMQQILSIQRPTDIPDSGLVCDLLWSDPDRNITEWNENDRGVSFTFGRRIVQLFLDRFELDLICRGHQVVEDGYEFFAHRRLVTIFSAPNYFNEFDNAGGVMNVDDKLLCSFHILKPDYRRKKYVYTGLPGVQRPTQPNKPEKVTLLRSIRNSIFGKLMNPEVEVVRAKAEANERSTVNPKQPACGEKNGANVKRYT